MNKTSQNFHIHDIRTKWTPRNIFFKNINKNCSLMMCYTEEYLGRGLIIHA